jgi:AraC-like DNA-binding protein
MAALRVRTTVFAMADLTPPWGVRFPAGSGAYVHTVTGSGCWLRVDAGATVRLEAGDVALVAHADAHELSNPVDQLARVEFDRETWQPNTVVSVAPDLPQTPRAEAVHLPGTLVCGAIDIDPVGGASVLQQLPAVLVLSAREVSGTQLHPTLELLGAESRRAQPGHSIVLARLGDVLLIQLLRAWLARDEPVGQGWLGALRDPQVTAALQAIHAAPARAWTVEELAACARLSRSRFAQRFTEVTGEAPVTYLTRWRLTVAAGLLREGQPVSRVARAVGYTSEPAFSRAFRRLHQQAPSRLRAGTGG